MTGAVPAHAARLHARAVEANERGRPQRAEALLRRALGDPAARGGLRVRILVTLALVESEQGGLDRGLRVLDEAEVELAGLDPAEPGVDQLAGLVEGQRGLVLLRAGCCAEAVQHLDRAVGHLAERPLEQARALLNRGTAALLLGDLRAAGTVLDRAVETARRADWQVGWAKATANLGYLALLRGDLPTALRLTDEGDRVLVPLGGGVDGVSRINRARMLMAAGLLCDAESELRLAVGMLRGARLTQDRAEAELNLAQVALADGRPGEARRWARAASRRFAARGAAVWALQCDLLLLQADRMQRRGLPAASAAATAMAPSLRDHGMQDEARVAELIAADCAVASGATGAPGTAAESGAPVRPPALRAGERIGTRLLARAVRADLAEATGQRRTAATERARGLAELHRYQARFGSLDLQSGASGLGRRLAEDGLAAAVLTGRPQQVLAWSERARATTSRTPALRPPADPVAAELLADLRFVRTTLQEARLAGRDGADERRLHARRRELERTIRRRSWYADGAGEVEAPATLGQVRDAVHRADGGALVSYVTVDGVLHALVVSAAGGGVRRLGPEAAVVQAVQRVRADLDVLALARIPAPVRQVAARSLRTGVEELQRQVWDPLAGVALPDDGPVVVVPCAAVTALPWTNLPALRGRPVSVAPSATWWLSSRGRAAAVPPGGSAVFVAGPHVERAAAEVRAAAAVWPRATVLTGDDATGRRVLAAAEGASLWHLAAHGVHEGDNPLFSSVQLADGALFGYDVDCLARVPAHVVLSACDLGLSTVRGRDEALGMTAALLHGGATDVVAGVARVADDAAFDVGVRLHQGLRAGRSTAQALADALCAAEVDGLEHPPPMVCFGAGW